MGVLETIPVRKQMPIRLPNDLYMGLKKKSERTKVSMNSLITQAVARWLKEDSEDA